MRVDAMTVKAEELRVVEVARRAAQEQLSFFNKMMEAKRASASGVFLANRAAGADGPRDSTAPTIPSNK
jgi:hypothetical protein